MAPCINVNWNDFCDENFMGMKGTVNVWVTQLYNTGISMPHGYFDFIIHPWLWSSPTP